MDGKENMILPIYTFGQPVLRQEAEEIDKDYPELEQLIKNMYETLERSEGIGLAAPQVGLPIRVVVINLDVISDDLPEYKGYIKTFINPYIEEYDETEQDVMEEGCLSLPGIHEKVKRPTRIRVTYQDEQFQEHDEWVTGYMSSITLTALSSQIICKACVANSPSLSYKISGRVTSPATIRLR